MSDVFRFKRFEIDQTGCAMKINTDGVLLGAMATAYAPAHILDIGTGTGVIALMLAQRFPTAAVTAIEVDREAAEAAQQNFSGSPFASKLSCIEVALESFETTVPYDLMVSNPPFFLQSLTNSDERKRRARHTEMSFFNRLLANASAWLTPTGSLQLVLPVTLAQRVVLQAAEFGLASQWEVAIRSYADANPIRKIVALGREGAAGIRHDFVIYERRGEHSDAYRQLLKDFFIAF